MLHVSLEFISPLGTVWLRRESLSRAGLTRPCDTVPDDGASSPVICAGASCQRIYLSLASNRRPHVLCSYDADGGRARKETATEITRYIGAHY